jgi:tetratricopeptide (TPR) repeat protein
MPAPDPLAGLFAAVTVSPDNLPLRQHLAEALRGLGRLDEAEGEYKTAVSLFPNETAIRVGLAQVYYQQGKASPALVIVEDLLKRPNTPPAAVLLHARLLYKAGDVDRAVRQYKEAIAQNPALTDPEFAGRLGIGMSEVESDVIDGGHGRRCGNDIHRRITYCRNGNTSQPAAWLNTIPLSSVGPVVLEDPLGGEMGQPCPVGQVEFLSNAVAVSLDRLDAQV